LCVSDFILIIAEAVQVQGFRVHGGSPSGGATQYSCTSVGEVVGPRPAAAMMRIWLRVSEFIILRYHPLYPGALESFSAPRLVVVGDH
jgi:hypothetical protein